MDAAADATNVTPGPDAMAGEDSESPDTGMDSAVSSNDASDGTAPSTDASEPDGATMDGATTDSGGGDAGNADGGDAATVCSGAADDTACVNPSTGVNDFCLSMACNACTDVTDDAHCAAAYAGTLCVGGACVPGNCHTSADCNTATPGEICGVATANTCGKCTDDLQCQNDSIYGSGDICNVGTGACVPATCGTGATGTVNNACAANSGDVCCPATSGDKCVAGNCCPTTATNTTTCASTLTCTGNVCTACSAATGNILYVDPAAGSDNGHTGASTCPFKTITKALEFLGANAAAGTTVQLVDFDPATNGETFPILVPKNVVIETSAMVATPVKVTVAAGKAGFILDAPSSGLSNLVIDGAANTATSGIAAYGGSAVASTQVTNVTVQNFLASGIVVGTVNKQATAGAVTLGPGVVVTGNGTTMKPAPGVAVTSGTATITGAAGAGHTSVHGNTQHGILVTGSGFVTISGSAPATAPGVATVDADNNAIAGLWISQMPGGVTSSQTNMVTGLEVTGTVGGNGVHVEGGSFLTMTNSYIVGNHASGVVVSSSGNGPAANSVITGINFGKIGAPGGNTFQGPIDNLTNPVAGICLAIPAAVTAGAAQTLSAEGNIWSSTVDCKTSAGSVTHTAACANGIDIGGIGGANNRNTADVAMCTLQ
jgi:hypothetical protein